MVSLTASTVASATATVALAAGAVTFAGGDAARDGEPSWILDKSPINSVNKSLPVSAGPPVAAVPLVSATRGELVDAPCVLADGAKNSSHLTPRFDRGSSVAPGLLGAPLAG